MFKNSKIFYIVFVIFFVIIFIATFGLLNGYFEQDEWLAIANVMVGYNKPWWYLFVPGQIHFTPVGHIIYEVLYKLFGLQATYYYIVELFIHTATATLVYILTARLTNNKAIAALAGLLFLVNGRAHQGFTHLAIFNTTTTAMFFILLFFTYLTGIKEKIFTIKNTLVLFLIFLAAVSTREEGFIIIPILIVYLLTFGINKLNKKNIVPAAVFSAGFIGFLFFRYFAQTLYKEPIPVQYQITGAGAEYNLMTLLPKYIIQNLIEFENVVLFLINYTPKFYPDIVTGRPPVNDTAFFFIFSLIVIIFLSVMWYIKPKKLMHVLLFCLAWIGANALLLAFVGRHIYVLEPRYLYFSAFPVFLLFSIFVYHLFTFKYKFKFFGLLSKGAATFLVGFIIVTSFQQIRAAVDYKVKTGNVKKNILENIHNVHPKLGKNTIFYISCKNKCYRNSEFGIPVENVLPFPSGPGLNILLTYAAAQHEEKEWEPFFRREFLFHLLSEDYKKIGDRSYGYFTTKTKLENTLKKNKIPKENVVALEYNEENFTFKDISKEFRKTLQEE